MNLPTTLAAQAKAPAIHSAQCEVWQLGRVAYQAAWELQNQLVQQRARDESPDCLLLLEHPHTYTLGSSSHEEHLLMSPEERTRLGVEVLDVDRGGDITYHGPGQLVGYPILRLPHHADFRADVVGYIRKLETVIIRTLADYDIFGKTIAGLTGVWVDTSLGEAKVCAIGVKVNARMVTKHGFAFNINTDLRFFDGIVPCGIHDKGVTSIAQLLGAPVDENEVASRLIAHFGNVFSFEMVASLPESSPS
jgi:lipoyl(octanoyl) transferase